MASLEHAREEIDKIDRQMAELFEQRLAAAKEVVEYKIANDLPIFDSVREQKVIGKNILYLKNHDFDEYYTDFITNIMQGSKRFQKSIANAGTVGFQGTQGAFSHIAAMNLFKENKLKSYRTFDEIFSAIEENEIQFGVIPFENSYTGEVGEVLDLLFAHNCKITQVFNLKINQNLLAPHGSKIGDVKQVYSHHQALSQCKEFLDKYPNYTLIPYPNTALAAEFVSNENDISKAAIASIETAKLYGLAVLAENINTSLENTTKFIVLSKKLLKQGNRFNLMFTLKHDAGQLAGAMQIIAKYGFNLESIKSRAVHNLPWQYYFYMEIEGNAFSDKSVEMMTQLKEKCIEFKVIGTYFA